MSISLQPLRPTAFVIVLVLLATDCGGEPEAAPEPAVPAPAAETARELTPDEQLAEDVRAAMAQAPALQTENIEIAVSHRQVFLAGHVSAPHLRDEAVAVAGEVPGVLSVQSKINVRR